jgi:thioredoxin 1
LVWNIGCGSRVTSLAGMGRRFGKEMLMATVGLNKENFAETVQSDGIVLVDWWASWCGPCLRFAPVYDAASAENEDIVFGKVDTEEEQALAGSARISSIPTLMAFRDGVLVFSQPGALPASALNEVISAVRDLDMDEVRSKIAEQSAATSA